MIRRTGFQLFFQGKKVNVGADARPVMDRMAPESGRLVHDKEIADFLVKNGIIRDFARDNKGITRKLVRDYKYFLMHKELKCAAAYPLYGSYVQEMHDLEKKYPGLCKVEQYGKAANGTPLYALKVSGQADANTSAKPAVLFTGLIHAREWATGMTTLQTAKNLLEGYGHDAGCTKKLDQAEIWFIPVVNPEGYDYSRTVESFWRKNRRVIYQDGTACPAAGAPHEKAGVGVDLNRNFWDPKHKSFYRISKDSPCSTKDDFGASDDPDAEDYRGSHGASEPEVQALQQFMASHKNLIAMIDHHSYGNQILYPWGHTKSHVRNVAEYLDAARAMQQAGGQNFKIGQSIGLYPTTGSSEDYEHVKGIFNFTVEMGTHFHSSRTELDRLMRQIPRMDAAFVDWVLAHQEKLAARRSRLAA